jgi:hypothetical protein
MATIDGNLWEYNFAHVVVLDVTDDYRYRQGPLPSDCYPILAEMWIPVYEIDRRIGQEMVQGYLYDWHESPPDVGGAWYVGVVDQGMIKALEA